MTKMEKTRRGVTPAVETVTKAPRRANTMHLSHAGQATVTTRQYARRAVLYALLLTLGGLFLFLYLIKGEGSVVFLLPTVVVVVFLVFLACGFKMSYESLRPRASKKSTAKVAAMHMAEMEMQGSPLPIGHINGVPHVKKGSDKATKTLGKLLRYYGGGLQGMPDDILMQYAQIIFNGESVTTSINSTTLYYAPVLSTLTSVLQLSQPRKNTSSINLVKLYTAKPVEPGKKKESIIVNMEQLFLALPGLQIFFHWPHFFAAIIRGQGIERAGAAKATIGNQILVNAEVYQVETISPLDKIADFDDIILKLLRLPPSLEKEAKSPAKSGESKTQKKPNEPKNPEVPKSKEPQVSLKYLIELAEKYDKKKGQDQPAEKSSTATIPPAEKDSAASNPPKEEKLDYVKLIEEMFQNVTIEEILKDKHVKKYEAEVIKIGEKIRTIAIGLMTLKGRYLRDFQVWWKSQKAPKDEKKFAYEGRSTWVKMFLQDKPEIEQYQVPITFTLAEGVSGDIIKALKRDLVKHDIEQVYKEEGKVQLMEETEENLKIALNPAITWNENDLDTRLKGFKAATQKEGGGYRQSLLATYETFEDDAISEMAAVFIGVATFLVLAWKYYSELEPNKQGEKFPLKISQIHVTQKKPTPEARTGWDYVYHTIYPGSRDGLEVIETMENTGTHIGEEQPRLREKLERYLDYELPKFFASGGDHIPSELTISGVFPKGRGKEGILAVFYRVEANFLIYVLNLFKKWNEEGKNLDNIPTTTAGS